MKSPKFFAIAAGLLVSITWWKAERPFPLRDALQSREWAENMGSPSEVIEAARQGPGPSSAQAQAVGESKARKILVILSSENKITLKDGVVHPTGFFLSELMVPLQKLLDAGYEPVFANPKGNKAVMDEVSDRSSWFGSAPEAQLKHQQAKDGCRRLGICGEGLEGSRTLKSLQQVLSEGLDQYAGVFLPGGHAPMEDLWKDKNLGAILRHFHDAGKPTALICHAPIALLSTLNNPEEYIRAVEKKDVAATVEQIKGWIYQSYSLTVFTTAEEKQEEPGQDNALGGFVRFYPDKVLGLAGAYVNRAPKWNSNAIRSKELITGQNPMSDEAFAKLLLSALNAQAAGK